MIAASPALERILVAPQTEYYTEFWALDSNHSSNDYPSNLLNNSSNTIFLNIANHIGYCGYYVIMLKMTSDPLPDNNILNNLPIDQASIYNLTAIVPNNSTWTLPINFSLSYDYNNTASQVNVSHLDLNENMITLNNFFSNYRTQEPKGFFVNMYFELWLYDTASNNFLYNERYVNLPLNMTIIA